MTDNHNGTGLPLKSAWDAMCQRYNIEARMPALEIELLRLAFFHGARSAVMAASRGSVVIRMMHSELRVFEREMPSYAQNPMWNRTDATDGKSN